MLFYRYIFPVAISCLVLLSKAAPLVQEDGLSVRHESPEIQYLLARSPALPQKRPVQHQKSANREADKHAVSHPGSKREKPLSKGDLSQHILKVQKGQSQHTAAKQKKKLLNNKIASKVARPKAVKGYAKMNPKYRAIDDARRSKEHEAAKSRKISEAQKAAKAARAKKWATKPKTVQKPPKGPKLSKQHRQEVANALKHAGERMQKTKNIPERKDKYTIGKSSFTGNEVRKATMNSYLHRKVPIGRGKNTNPKEFNNDPYSNIHSDISLQGMRPIPGNPKRIKEYPIIKNSPSGWTGGSQVGAGRVVTYKDHGRDTVQVIGHDSNRGGTEDDHYLATVERAKKVKFNV